jgi:hypothetical protein
VLGVLLEASGKYSVFRKNRADLSKRRKRRRPLLALMDDLYAGHASDFTAALWKNHPFWNDTPVYGQTLTENPFLGMFDKIATTLLDTCLAARIWQLSGPTAHARKVDI